MELKDRLRMARLAVKPKKLNQEQVAQQIGLTQSAYSQLENGKTQSTGADVIFKLADIFGVDPNWLATGEGEMIILDKNKLALEISKRLRVERSNADFSSKSIEVWQDGDIAPEGMIAIDFHPDVCGSLGNGFLNEEPIGETKLWFREETLRECNVNPMFAKAFVARGDSMAPDITDGQTIAVDTSATRIFDGEIYAFLKNGELKIKYLFKHGDGFKAVSRNEDKLRYPDEIYTAQDIEADNIEILGQYWWKSQTRRVRR